LITARQSAADSRANTIELTDAGARLVEAAWIGLETKQDGLSEGIDEAALSQQLDILIASATRAIGAAR